MSTESRKQAVERAQQELEGYIDLLENYKRWRREGYAESFADSENAEIRRKASEALFLVDDLTEEEMNELESEWRASQEYLDIWFDGKV